MSVKRVRFLQFICAVFALSSTGTLVLTSMASADAVVESGTVAQAMQSAASWPLHVVLGAVALGWQATGYNNGAAVGVLADASGGFVTNRWTFIFGRFISKEPAL